MLQGGTEAQKKHCLPKLASGEVMVGVSVTEPDIGSDVAGVKCRAVRGAAGGQKGWFIQGPKAWCTFAGRANVLALLARTDPDPAAGRRGLSLFIVPKQATSGHQFEPVGRPRPVPELKRAFESGETVFIPDAAEDPELAGVLPSLDGRGVRSIVVVPMRWRASVIGALALRTGRGADPIARSDIEFCEMIASLAAKALRNAHRYETLRRTGAGAADAERDRRVALERIALIGFLRRLLDRYAAGDDHAWSETLLPRASDEEIDRLTSVPLQVIAEEARG